MAQTINPADLGSIVAGILDDYSDEVVADAKETALEAAELARVKVRDLSPKQGGKYRRGWRVVNDDRRLSFSVYVRNSQYQLVHLLENGHQIVSHGKAVGRSTRPIEHVGPAQEYAEEEWTRRLLKRLK